MKNVILLSLLLLLGWGSMAQKPNIAPQANITAGSTQGGCQGGPCSALNDSVYGSCGTQQVYISTANPPSSIIGEDYIEWQWPTVRTFNKLKIYHGSGLARLLQGATMQKWDGNQWVTTGTFSGLPAPACVATVNFAKVTTNRFRITAFQMSFGQTSNPNFREIEIFAATTSPHDAGVVAADSLQGVCPVSSPVEVEIQNFGTTILDSVQVNWTVNGVLQPAVWHRNTLDTLGGTGASKAHLTLGNFNFSANTTYQLKYWTSSPNGLSDNVNSNDTLRATTSLGAPSGLAISGITDSSAEFSWNPKGITNFTIIYGPTGFDPATGGSLLNTSTIPTTLPSLSPGSDYDVYLLAQCGGGNSSDTSTVLSFRTLCFNLSPTVLPYQESFNMFSGTYLGSYTPVFCGSQAQWHFQTDQNQSGQLNFGNYSQDAGTGASLDAQNGAAVNDLILTLNLSNYDTSTTQFITLSFYHLDHGDVANTNDYVWVRGDTTQNWLNVYNLEQNLGHGQWSQAFNIDLTQALRQGGQNFGSNFQVRFGQEGTQPINSATGINGRSFDKIQIQEKSCLEISSVQFPLRDSSRVSIVVNSASAFEYEWGPCGFLQGTGTISTASGGDTISGLNPNSCYSFYVRNNCGSQGWSYWTGPFNINTDCGAWQAPYNQSFDQAPAQNALKGVDCWSVAGPLANSISLENNLSQGLTPASAPNAVEFNGGNIANGDSSLLISPQFSDLSAADKRIEFKAAFNNLSSSLLVGVLESRYPFTGLTIVDTINSVSTGSFNTYVVDFLNAGQVSNASYIVFLHGDDNRVIYLDDFEYKKAPDCIPPAPSTLGISQNTATATELYWGSGSQGSKTYIEVGPAGFLPGTGNYYRLDSTLGTVDTLLVTGLIAQTTYEFYVRDRCPQDSLSQWVGPYSFTPPCNVFPAPFYEGFEPNSTTIDCWSNQYVRGSRDWIPNSGSATGGSITTAQAGATNMLFQGSSQISRFISPAIDLAGLTNPKLSFYYAQEQDILASTHGIKVLVRALGDTSWIEIFSDFSPRSVWTHQEVILPLSLGGDTVEIAFEGHAQNSLYGGLIDNMRVIQGPSCVAPVNLQASTATTSALLSWQEFSPASQFQVWVGPLNFFQGTQTTTGNKSFVTVESLTVSTLQGDSCYEFLVRSVCGPGDTSQWVGPITFCTSCGPRTAPYFQDFEQAQNTIPPQCWQNSQSDGPADWHFNSQTSERPSAAQGDHTKGPGGNGIMAWMDGNNTSSASLLMPPLDISALNDAKLSFWIWAETNSSQSLSFPLHIDVKTANGWINNVGYFDIENSSWQQKTVSLSAFSGVVLIRFRGVDQSQLPYKDLAIDDVRLYDAASPCNNIPQNIATNALACDSVRLVFQSASTQTMVEYGPAGYSPGNGTNLGLVTSPHTINGLTANSAYDIHLANVCANDTGSWSAPLSFTTPTTPLPQADFSVAVSTNNSGQIEVYVDASASANASSYQWIYSNAITTGLKDTAIFGASTTETIVLIARNGCGTDTLSKTLNLSVGLADFSKIPAINVYPNPVTNVLTIENSIPEVRSLQVRIWDARGNLVLIENPQLEKDQKRHLNLQHLPPGVYILELKSASKAFRKKLIVK